MNLILSMIALLAASVYFVQVIGEEVKRSMSKTIQYSNEPVGDLNLIPDFLPSPEELALKQKTQSHNLS